MYTALLETKTTQERGTLRRAVPPLDLSSHRASPFFSLTLEDIGMDKDTDSTETHMGEPCDICGDIGVLEALCTCSKCKIGREHFYCRQAITDDAPALWLCEACDLPKTSMFDPSAMVDQDNAHSASCSKIPKDSKRLGHFKREKIVQTGKVKYMSAHEAIKLSSGAMEFALLSKRNFHSSFTLSKSVRSMSTRTPIKPQVLSPKSSSFTPSKIVPSGSTRTLIKPQVRSPKSSQSFKANPRFGPVELLPSRHCNTQINLVTKQEVVRIAEDSKGVPGLAISVSEKKAGLAPRMEHIHKRKPIYTRKPAVETKSESTREGKKVNKASSSSSTVLHFPPVISSGSRMSCGNDCRNVGSGNLDVEDGGLVTVLPNVEECYRGPALHYSWAGSFKIFDSIRRKELNDRFQAHPPSTVHCKVYEFSKKMPTVLQFKMLPRDSVWTDIFEDNYPDEDDIGLYFFSSDSQRSADYVFLLELIETRDFVMRSYIDGVELLIFSSKHLSSKSKRWNEKYFLWGVFRRVKKHKAVRGSTRVGNATISLLHGSDQKTVVVPKRLCAVGIPSGFDEIYRG